MGFDAHLFVLESANIIITDFTIVPSSIYEGASADFSVTVENIGNMEDTLNLSVSITNSSGDEVSVINYSPVNVTPGSPQVLTAAWSSAGLAVGTYSANATGVYGGGLNLTNSFVVGFSIISNATPTPSPSPSPEASLTPAPSVSPGGPGAPMASFTVETPTTIPPTLKPKIGVISFSRKTVLIEALAGEGALLTLSLHNSGADAVAGEIVFTGLPRGTPPIPRKKIFLQPDASSSIDYALWISADAVPGDYVVKISVLDASNASAESLSEEYLFLRVKSYPKNYENPIVLRRIVLDTDAKTTNVALSVRNPSLKTIDVIDVIDAIPSPLAATQNDVVFLDKIGSYLSQNPLTLLWRLTSMEPQEKGAITYSLDMLSDDYSVYGTWYTKQISTSRNVLLSNLVTITDFSIQSMKLPATKSKAGFRVFYGGLAPLQVSAAISVPSGFKVNPQTISNVVLAPRTPQEFEFEITADDGVNPGAYSTRAVIMSLNEQVSLAGTILVLPSDFAVGTAVLALVLIALAAAAFLFWRKKRESYYNRNRFTYGQSLRRIVFGEEKD